jgi:hypothetical protein
LPLLDEISQDLLRDEGYFDVLAKLKPLYLLLNRKKISQLWGGAYEFPSLLFFKEPPNQSLLQKILEDKSTYESMPDIFGISYLFHTSVEFDVLWIKSSDRAPELSFSTRS